MPLYAKEFCDTRTTRRGAFWISIWIILSASFITFNKWLLVTAHFPFPYLLTTIDLSIATTALHFTAHYTHLLDNKNFTVTRGFMFQFILPSSILFTISLCIGNQAYLYLNIAFSQMLKELTPLTLIIMSLMVDFKNTDLVVLANAAIIVAGALLAAYEDIPDVVDIFGSVSQLIAMVCEAARLLIMSRWFKSLDGMKPVVYIYFVAPFSAFFNFLMFIFIEGRHIHWAHVKKYGISALFAHSLFSLFLNVAIVYAVAETSALTFCLTGILKDFLLLGTTMVKYSMAPGRIQTLGCTISLLGLVYYIFGRERCILRLYALSDQC